MLVAGAVVGSIALVVSTWALAAAFQSPGQREANASPPPPEPVFAAVTTGVLADQRSYQGVVAHSDEADFTLPAASGAVRSVVTAKPPAAGATVGSGEVLTEVNTRPVFAIAAPFDFFRDIGFGDQGADVHVLQEALASRGYLRGADGRFGAQTATAVDRWYRDAGYEPPTRPRPAADAASASPKTSEPANESGASKPDPSSPPSPEPKAAVDPFVPVSELLAVPALPATIVAGPAVGAHVGGEDAKDLTLGANALIVRTDVPEAETAGIGEGANVTVASGSGEVDAVVADIQVRPPGEDGNPQPSVLTVSLSADAAELKVGRGDTVTVHLQNAVVAGKSLLVPTVAVVARGEGRGVVVRRHPDGSLHEVPVTVAGSLRGMTAVAPDETDALTEGDDVRVG